MEIVKVLGFIKHFPVWNHLKHNTAVYIFYFICSFKEAWKDLFAYLIYCIDVLIGYYLIVWVHCNARHAKEIKINTVSLCLREGMNKGKLVMCWCC